MNSEKKNRGIIGFLLLLVLIIGFLSYQNARDYEGLQTIFEEEKKDLKSELDKMIVNYDNAFDKNLNLSKNIKEKREKLASLRDTIINLKEENYNLIRKFRKQILTLERENRLLFAQVDSLNSINNDLLVENVTVKEELAEQNNRAQKLTEKYTFLKKAKSNLEKRVAKVSELEVTDIDVSAMKLKGDKYKTTSRSKITDAFRVSLTVLENSIAKAGKKKVYVTIIDMDKNIISVKGNIKLNNGKKMPYSDVFEIQYNNSKTAFVSLAKVDRDIIKKGKYIINICLEGNLVGNRIVTLK